jgi:hypothetical protein
VEILIKMENSQNGFISERKITSFRGHPSKKDPNQSVNMPIIGFLDYQHGEKK